MKGVYVTVHSCGKLRRLEDHDNPYETNWVFEAAAKYLALLSLDPDGNLGGMRLYKNLQAARKTF